MNVLSPEEVTRLAIEELASRHGVGPLASLAAGPVSRVIRLDRAGAFLLVPVRDRAGLRGLVQFDEASGRIESSAVVRDPSLPFLLKSADAVTAARRARPDLQSWGAPYLGWRPCRESPNSLRPLWVVSHATGVIYVTQDGEVADALSIGCGG